MMNYRVLTGVLVALSLTTSALPASAVPSDWTLVKEYVRQPYPSLNEATEHYFLTAYPEEQQSLEAGAFGGVFKTTSIQFYAWNTPGPNRVPVARFFGNTANGGPSSHFYTAYAEERDFVIKTWPNVWQLETPTAFYVALPSTDGLCMTGTKPIYRAYNQKADANHFYSNKLMEREALTVKGWVKEGSGPNAVAFCVPAEATKAFVANRFPFTTQAALGNTGPFSCMNQISVISITQPGGGDVEHLCVWSASGVAVAVSNVRRISVMPAGGTAVHTVSVVDNKWEYSSLPGDGNAIARDLFTDVFFFARGGVSPDTHNDIVAYDYSTRTVAWTSRISDVGYTPRAVVVAPRKLYVLLAASADNTQGKVVVLNLRSGEILATIAVSARPKTGTYDLRTGLLYVATSQGKTIEVIDTATDRVVSRWNLPVAELEPYGVAVDTASGRLYVTAWTPILEGYVQGGLLYYKDLRLDTWSAPLVLGYDPAAIAVVPIEGVNFLYIPNSNGRYFKTLKILPDDYGINVVNTASWRVVNRLPSESEPVGIDVYIPE